jgi:hypothetical protein
MSRTAGLSLAFALGVLLVSASGARAQNFGNVAINPYAGGVVEQVAACFSDETLNHIEISGGIEIWVY